MNPELQTQLTGWLSDIRAASAQGKEFVLREAPGYVQEMVGLGRIEQTLYQMIALVFIVFAVISFRFFCWIEETSKNDPKHELGSGYFNGCIVAGILMLIAIFFGCGFHDFLSAWFAPKVYVIEHLAKMLGK